MKEENMDEFKFDSQVCTDINQSERLLALGLKKRTADCVWIEMSKNDWRVDANGWKEYYSIIEEGIAPAWSLHRLIELIKKSDYLHYDDMGCIKLYFEQDDFDRVIAIISILVKEGYFNKEYLV